MLTTHASHLSVLDEQLETNEIAISAYKAAIKSATADLAERFEHDENVCHLVLARSHFIDQILQRIWNTHMPADADAALIAVGGYGRGELHPGSDVDVLILTKDDPQTIAEPIEQLVMMLWDIGLEVGHSVRSLDQCVEEAGNDITIATNLMESRLLIGKENLFNYIKLHTDTEHMWPSDQFYTGKMEEQKARHAKVDDSGYDLEPNIKTNPGGLRDIQIIGWVAKRHFAETELSSLVKHNFLTQKEYESLKQGEKFLWGVRFALHTITGKHEDRLFFEHQRILARQFGYCDENTNLAVEQFMQEYYRCVVKLQRLNEMLLQLFQDAILLKNHAIEAKPISRRFQARNQYLEIIDPDLFTKKPLALIEVFLVLQQNPEVKGVSANTIRSIQDNLHLVDDSLRNDIAARSLFMEILRQPSGLTHELRRMHRHGVLERYLPAFQKITGLMQFDLFHVYTVDEHSLMVVRNMRRATLEEHRDECDLCYRLMQQLPKPELLYLSGIFHDIAKGRGGNHADLGAVDARNFCLLHDLSSYDAELVSWLVKVHLNMSSTAQRRDIDDPEVVREFAAEVGTQERLDYLYLLTVADMRGTNPSGWNSWKGSLLARLHYSTSEALKQGLAEPKSEDHFIEQVQQESRGLLGSSGINSETITLCWMELSTEYFLQSTAKAISWHTQLLHASKETPTQYKVSLRNDSHRGCTEMFIFGPDIDGLFAKTAALLDRANLDVLGARIDVSSQDTSINSYYILNSEGALLNEEQQQDVRIFVENNLNQGELKTEFSQQMGRQLKSFVQETLVEFNQDKAHAITRMELTSTDQPGLLSKVGNIFSQQKIRLHSAIISTTGAKAHDVFTLTDLNDQPIYSEEWQEAVKQALIEKLN